ncbi:MAG: hypothetical protein PVH98_03265 [Gammaproteobacteria bacterium]|jgi:hypothetical protein
MNNGKTFRGVRTAARFLVAMIFLVALAACSSGGNSDGNDNGEVLNLDMQIPDSLTGGPATSVMVSPVAISAVSASSDLPCAYQGPENEDDPFRNGYEMTKFMVSAVAAWTCWADTLIEIAGYVPHDGQITATENQTDVDNYEADEPTHYSVTDDSETQTTVRLYYGYDRDVPPLPGEDPQFFLSWNTDINGDIQGRLIIDATGIDPVNRNPEDPTMMRMDFDFSATDKHVDMFLRFDDGNEWAEGFRIEVSKDLTAAPFEQVFTARGMINAKRQFIDVPSVSEIPVLRMYTVSDQAGEGAAVADLDNVALPLELNAATGNHLGDYLFDKLDTYFFDANQTADEPWDWIHKTFSYAEYRGGRTTPATGGTLFPVFDPSLDQIILELGLPNTYFTGNQCASIGDDCTDLMNAIFAGGFADQEPNQGGNPNDWRSAALQNPDYLETVYPNGSDWQGAFDFVFVPENQ